MSVEPDEFAVTPNSQHQDCICFDINTILGRLSSVSFQC